MSYTFYNRAPEKNRAFAKKMNVFLGRARASEYL